VFFSGQLMLKACVFVCGDGVMGRVCLVWKVVLEVLCVFDVVIVFYVVCLMWKYDVIYGVRCCGGRTCYRWCVCCGS